MLCWPENKGKRPALYKSWWVLLHTCINNRHACPCPHWGFFWTVFPTSSVQNWYTVPQPHPQTPSIESSWKRLDTQRWYTTEKITLEEPAPKTAQMSSFSIVMTRSAITLQMPVYVCGITEYRYLLLNLHGLCHCLWLIEPMEKNEKMWKIIFFVINKSFL